MPKKYKELETLDTSALNAYLAGLELEKIEITGELSKVTTKHNKITKIISEVKAELMSRNSRRQKQMKIGG